MAKTSHQKKGAGGSIGRRRFLQGTAAAVAAGGLSAPIIHAPYVHAQGKATLRVTGTGVTLIEVIRKQAEQDLGIALEFDVKDGVAAQQKAITQPQAYDIYDQWFNSIDLVWPSKSLQPIDVNRIALWNEVNNVTKTGRITADAPIGDGDAPVRKIYVQDDNSLGATASERISLLPFTHNVDSFGYNTDIVPRGTAYEGESWAWMFDDAWAGKVALLNDPAIGLMDAALAAKATGQADFEDIGNMTRDEIDTLVDLLIEKKRAGHFRAFWSSFTESVNLMASGEVVLESMWSPAVTALRIQGVPVVYAAPKEGYRAWHGGMGLSARAEGRVLDAAYEYMNWWLSGWPGAVMARQGYYMSVTERVRAHLSPAEWDYWYEGKPAAEDLKGPGGDVAVRAGETRNGGSYWQRMSNIAVWNSVMDQHPYLVRRWNEFLLA